MFKFKKKILYPFISFSIALTLIFTNAKISYAIPWGDLIFRGIQVIQISNLSDQQEVQYGSQIRQQLLSQNNVRLYQNQELSRYVNQIGRRLVAVSSRPNLPFQFEIINNNEVNAFATMGGFVYLHTGLITTASNEAELASVIAHEIGHVVARHAQKQIRQQAVTQGLLTATGLNQTDVVRLGVDLAVNLPHSRQDEYEADNLGLEMLKSAGYAPRAMVDFMQKLGQTSGRVPTLLSTHPNGLDRAIALDKKIPRSVAYNGDGLDAQEYQSRIQRLIR